MLCALTSARVFSVSAHENVIGRKGPILLTDCGALVGVDRPSASCRLAHPGRLRKRRIESGKLTEFAKDLAISFLGEFFCANAHLIGQSVFIVDSLCVGLAHRIGALVLVVNAIQPKCA